MSGAVVKHSGLPNTPLSPPWPNKRTFLTSLLVISNIACMALDSPFWVTPSIHFPLRLAIVAIAIYNRKYEGSFQALNWSTFLFPYGHLVSGVADVASEVVGYGYSIPPPSAPGRPVLRDLGVRKDPTARENALAIFNLQDVENVSDQAIKEQYEFLVNSLTEKKNKANATLAVYAQSLIDDVHVAFETLTDEDPYLKVNAVV